MASFEKALKKVLASEGGYANDVHDPGGETYCGISRRYWKNWDGWKIIDKHKPIKTNHVIINIPLHNSVRYFYQNKFWDPLNCHWIQNQSVAESLFDFAVNAGKSRVAKILQHTVNVYSPRARIKVDGKIGPKSLAAINRVCEKSSKFPNGFIRARIEFYLDLCYNSPKKYRYLNGWIIRSLKSLEK